MNGKRYEVPEFRESSALFEPVLEFQLVSLLDKIFRLSLERIIRRRVKVLPKGAMDTISTQVRKRCGMKLERGIQEIHGC